MSVLLLLAVPCGAWRAEVIRGAAAPSCRQASVSAATARVAPVASRGNGYALGTPSRGVPAPRAAVSMQLRLLSAGLSLEEREALCEVASEITGAEFLVLDLPSSTQVS